MILQDPVRMMPLTAESWACRHFIHQHILHGIVLGCFYTKRWFLAAVYF